MACNTERCLSAPTFYTPNSAGDDLGLDLVTSLKFLSIDIRESDVHRSNSNGYLSVRAIYESIIAISSPSPSWPVSSYTPLFSVPSRNLWRTFTLPLFRGSIWSCTLCTAVGSPFLLVFQIINPTAKVSSPFPEDHHGTEHEQAPHCYSCSLNIHEHYRSRRLTESATARSQGCR